MDCTVRGGQFGKNRDRDFLIFDVLKDNAYITAALYPKLVMLEAYVINNILTLTDSASIVNGKPAMASCDLSQVILQNNKQIAKLVMCNFKLKKASFY